MPHAMMRIEVVVCDIAERGDHGSSPKKGTAIADAM
jgi:hypothetical protein